MESPTTGTIAAWPAIVLDAPDTGAQLRLLKQRSYDLLDLHVGDRVLDAGCGLGDDVRAIAALVGLAGQVTGIDQRAESIAEARRRSEGSGLAVDFQEADLHALPFADAGFDRVRADRTLFYVADIRRAVEELVRVLRPGGRLVVVEPDWETLTIDLPDRAVTRAVLNAYCDGLPEGWAGRRLPALFHDAGLAAITVAPLPLVTTDAAVLNQFFPLEASAGRAAAAGAITSSAAAAWLAGVEEAGRAGRLFAVLTAFAVAGQKPSA